MCSRVDIQFKATAHSWLWGGRTDSSVPWQEVKGNLDRMTAWGTNCRYTTTTLTVKLWASTKPIPRQQAARQVPFFVATGNKCPTLIRRHMVGQAYVSWKVACLNSGVGIQLLSSRCTYKQSLRTTRMCVQISSYGIQLQVPDVNLCVHPYELRFYQAKIARFVPLAVWQFEETSLELSQRCEYQLDWRIRVVYYRVYFTQVVH